MILSTQAQIDALLRRSRTIAVVGVSPNPERPSHDMFVTLRARARFEVTPINPAVEQIDGAVAFPSLHAYAKAHGPPDIVDVFRKSADALAVTQDAIAVGARAIWYQLGVIDDAAIALADGAGLNVVVNRCLKTDT